MIIMAIMIIIRLATGRPAAIQVAAALSTATVHFYNILE